MTSESPLILLLGGAGYIGIHIMLALHGLQVPGSRKGHCYQVALVDKCHPPMEAIQYAERNSGLPVLWHVADLEKREYPDMPRTPHCGIMLAALKDVGEGEEKPHEYTRTNVTLCVNSMEYLGMLGVTRLIQASSAAVYHTGNHRDGEPLGMYGYTKRITEDICRRLMLPTQQLLILRYMNPIGSHPDLDLFPSIGICKKLCEMKPSETFVNRGDCVRDYIHITDLAAFHSDALEAWDDTLFHETQDRIVILDVGTGIRVSVSELVRLFGLHSGHGEKNIIRGERLRHEGYDTVGYTDEIRRLIPRFWERDKIELPVALKDYQRIVRQ